MEGKSTRVFFVFHVSSKYGAGRSLLSLIDGLVQKGVKCYVIMPNEGPMVEEFKNREVECCVIPFKGWASYDKTLWKKVLRGGFNLLISLVVAAKAGAWKADIIYTNSSVTPVGALAAFLLRKPHIWHIREFGDEDYGLSFDFGDKWSMRLMDRLSFRIIVISEALKRKYIQYIRSQKIQRIYNAVHPQNEIDSDLHVLRDVNKPTTPTLVIVGLLHPGKGHVDALLAVADLVTQGVQVKLKIVGSGSGEYPRQLKRIVVQSKIAEHVEFTGYVDNPYSVIKLANIVLVCSRSEAFGRVTVESMLLRKPVIGTRSGANTELIKEGFNGLLYQPGNYQELAEKIKYLIGHPQEANQMGENGFKMASTKYTVEKCAGEILDVLQEATESKRTKRNVYLKTMLRSGKG